MHCLASRTSSSPVLEKCHNLVVCLWCPLEVKGYLGFTVKTSALPHRTPAVWASVTPRGPRQSGVEFHQLPRYELEDYKVTRQAREPLPTLGTFRALGRGGILYNPLWSMGGQCSTTDLTGEKEGRTTCRIQGR